MIHPDYVDFRGKGITDPPGIQLYAEDRMFSKVLQTLIDRLDSYHNLIEYCYRADRGLKSGQTRILGSVLVGQIL